MAAHESSIDRQSRRETAPENGSAAESTRQTTQKQDPRTVKRHLELALEKTEDDEMHHHIRHALLYLG